MQRRYRPNRLLQLFFLAGKEVVGPFDDAVVDFDATLGAQLFDQLEDLILRDEIILIALNEQTGVRAGCQEGEVIQVRWG